jgi:5-methylcytosine-specific restriction endonuclease McrA
MSGRKPAPSSIGRSGNRYSKEACQKGAVARVTKVREGWISKPFSEISGKGMRFRILHEQNNQCSECGIGKTWNNKPLTLQLDHIDGDRKNNTRENLRMICPNCHTQTHTYGSKNVKDRSKLATYGNRDCD